MVRRRRCDFRVHMPEALTLHDAAQAGNGMAVETIVTEAATPLLLLEALRHKLKGQSPVEVAMHSGHLDVASQLLAAERRVVDEIQRRLKELPVSEPLERSQLSAEAPVLAASDPRIIEDSSPTCPWESIQAYAADQETEAAAQRGPRRTHSIADRYRRYSAWCATRGHTGVDLILGTAIWIPAEIADVDDVTSGGGAGRIVGHEPTATPVIMIALEVNIVPYHLDPGIEHWILWYHPSTVPGTQDLDPSLFVKHLRRFLPSLRADDEVVAFQNLPQFRSVPQMAHAHIFLRPCTAATAAAVAKLRVERRLRSPWAEAERLGGRAGEVGWDDVVVPA